MEVAAAMVSFVGLVGTVAQGQKFFYDFTNNMKDCPKDILEMKTDIEFVEALIAQVVRQSNERDGRLRENAVLARAIGHAQESVKNFKKELDSYPLNGKSRRLRFAVKVNQTEKLRASLNRTKTIMLDLKNQLQSDVWYDIHETNQEVLRSVEKISKDLETNNRSFDKIKQKSEVQGEITNDFSGRGEASFQLANDTSSGGLVDMKTIAKELEHIEDSLTEKTISSSPNSLTSTPALSREVSDNSVTSSSQETTASSISSFQSIPPSVPQNARKANIASKYPLLQFKDNQFHFLVAIIFTQSTNNHRLACQHASECLAAYPTPEALSSASPASLRQYFMKLGLYNAKPPQLIALAKAYIKDPPQRGRLHSKARCPPSEISHLPQIGEVSVNAWLVYCCERVDVETKDATLLGYMEFLKEEARG